MHPIERLRYVARVSGADPGLVAREAAVALAEVASDEPVGLVPACRRLVERHVGSAPIWWVSARVLGAAEPVQAAWAAAAEFEADPTDRMLARALPEDTTVLIVGWPDTAATALRRRGDLEVLVVDAGGEGSGLARRLSDAGNAVAIVPDTGVGPAAVVAGLILVEALAAGPTGVLAAPGSHAAAAVAAQAGIPVWVVAPVGRVLPGALWDALLARLDDSGSEPWERESELVPAALFGGLMGPDGLVDAAEALASATCPVAPELLRPAG